MRRMPHVYRVIIGSPMYCRLHNVLGGVDAAQYGQDSASARVTMVQEF